MSALTSVKHDHVPKSQPLADSMASSREGSTKKLIICFLGIFISYFVFGVLQEKITKERYGDAGERFTFTLTLVFVQCIINAIFARCAMRLVGAEVRDTSPQKLFAAMSFSYIGAMVASNQALQYVSYPTQVIGKSVKPIPVMVLGVLLGGKRYPLQKYLFVLLIVAGVALFIFKDRGGAALDGDHTVGLGEILLLVSLGLDGMTGGIQDKLRAEHRPQTYRMMFFMNIWSVLYLAVGLIVTGEGLAFIDFAFKYPYVLTNLFTFSLCSAVGQNFIFLTVTSFGPLPCSIMTTTRKFFTILGSVILFQHPISGRQWLGTICVFIGLGLDSVYGKERRPAKR